MKVDWMSQREHEHITQCRACGADVVFLRTKKMKLMPVDAATVAHDDYQFDDTKHVSHFATCPHADQYRR
ncbi:MAG: hypothetical protein HYX63_13495 [Gammaproteobacteria bacterium]|nr:hypothetical protein [Gammaproteobacteria bacterium]